MNKKIALLVAGFVFFLVALLHIARIALNIEITAAGNTVPMYVSYIGFLVALLLSVWMFVASKR